MAGTTGPVVLQKSRCRVQITPDGLGPGAEGWRLGAGGWRLEAGGWRLEAGGWRLGWRLGAGGWGLEPELIATVRRVAQLPQARNARNG